MHLTKNNWSTSVGRQKRGEQVGRCLWRSFWRLHIAFSQTKDNKRLYSSLCWWRHESDHSTSYQGGPFQFKSTKIEFFKMEALGYFCWMQLKNICIFGMEFDFMSFSAYFRFNKITTRSQMNFTLLFNWQATLFFFFWVKRNFWAVARFSKENIKLHLETSTRK